MSRTVRFLENVNELFMYKSWSSRSSESAIVYYFFGVCPLTPIHDIPIVIIAGLFFKFLNYSIS